MFPQTFWHNGNLYTVTFTQEKWPCPYNKFYSGPSPIHLAHFENLHVMGAVLYHLDNFSLVKGTSIAVFALDFFWLSFSHFLST